MPGTDRGRGRRSSRCLTSEASKRTSKGEGKLGKRYSKCPFFKIGLGDLNFQKDKSISRLVSGQGGFELRLLKKLPKMGEKLLHDKDGR